MTCHMARIEIYTSPDDLGESMFNYYSTMTPHILCSNSPQIHLNNHTMCRFQFLPYAGMHRFQQTMSFTLNV